MANKPERLRIVAEAITTDMFISMLNPAYRGPKFKFKTFNIARYVEAHIFLGLTWNISVKEKKEAGRIAKVTWDKWIKRIGKGLPL